MLTGALLAIGAAGSATATTVVLLDDADLVSRADAVVVGRVLSVDPEASTERPTTRYQIAVDDVVLGEIGSSAIALDVGVGRVPGGPELQLYGAPEFRVDGEALLFLREAGEGTYRVVEFLQGAFHVLEADGRRFAVRDLDDVHVLGLHERTPDADPVRDLDAFVDWVRHHRAGVEAPRNYVVESPPPVLTPRFDFITSGGFRTRWRTFDSGGSVRFRALDTGQPGAPGGGFNDFAVALAAWTADPDTPVSYLYNGTIGGSPGGLTSSDGQNTILFDDPNGNANFDAPFTCSGGGTLAIGGPWVSTGPTHAQPFNGVPHREILEADVVTNKGISCWIVSSGRARELFAHELGHTLGLGHTSVNQAIMRATAHGDGRGAALHPDDLAGLCAIYCLDAPGGTPSAPTNLLANIESASRVRLFWTDNSSNETGFEVERSSGGGFTRITTTGAGAISYLDQSVAPESGYTYRVRAVNGGNASGYTNTVSVTTPAASGLVAPSGLTAVAVSSSRIDLAWNDNATTETGYEIQRELGTASVGTPRTFATVATVPAGSTDATMEDLQSATSYNFRVRAIGAGGATSGFSNEATAATFGDTTPCVPDATTACLNGGRFRVRVNWRDFDSVTGSAEVVDDTPASDSGLFWFFDPDNWEMLVKVLDACGVNDRFWVFSAATTTIEYTLTVTDTMTGAVRTYTNPLGTAAPALGDTEAFATCSARSSDEGDSLDEAGGADRGLAPLVASLESLEGGGSLVPRTCSGGPENLCLTANRFRAVVDWRDFDDNTGQGQVVPFGSADSGLFWFFEANNWEMLVKVLDACVLNDHYWVFSAATTTIEYTLRVTDTETGLVRSYTNPLGNAASALAEVEAFPCD